MNYSKYPYAIDTSFELPATVDGITPINAEVVNRLRDSIMNIEKELGIAPSSTFGSIHTRLHVFDSMLAINSYVNKDGSTPWIADQSMDGHKLYNLAPANHNKDALGFGQSGADLGSLTVDTGKFIFTGSEIDMYPKGYFNLTMDNGQQILFNISDNLLNSFMILDNLGFSYLKISTINGFEVITFGNPAINPGYNFIGSGTFTQPGSGQVSFNGNVNGTDGLDISVAALTMTGTNINLQPSGSFDLAMDPANAVTITLLDHLDNAFLIKQGAANNYFEIDTLNGFETIKVGNALTNPAVIFLGSGLFTQVGVGQVEFNGNVETTNGIDVSVGPLTMTGVNISLSPAGTFALDMDATKKVTISLLDNLDSALLIKEGVANYYFEVDTRNIGAQVNVGNTLTNPDYDFLGSGTFTQSGVGQASFGGNIDTVLGLDISGSAFTMTGTNIDLDPTGSFALDMDANRTITITTSNDLDIIAPPLLEPDDIADLKLWLRSDNPGIITAGGLVTTWPDYSPSAATHSQADAAKQPAYIASHSVFNNLPAIDFDGFNDFMQAAHDAILSLSNDQTVFIICDMDTVATQPRPITIYDVALPNAWQIYMGPNYIGAHAWTVSFPLLTTGLNALTWRLNLGTTTIEGWCNAQYSHLHTYNDVRALSGDSRIGVDAGVALFMDGRFGEIILYDRALTDPEVAQVQAYLNKRYAFGNGNNYFGIDTATDTINIGNAATYPDFAFIGDGTFTQSGVGQVSFGGNIDAKLGVDVSGTALTFTGTDINLDPTGTFALDMDPTKTATISLLDNLDEAFYINSAFAPDDLSGVVLWTRSDNPGIVLNGGNVQSWPDYSPSAATASNLVPAEQPLYIASHPAFNGHPAVDFDGIDDILRYPFGLPTSTSHEYTLFLVHDSDDFSTHKALLGGQYDGGSTGLIVQVPPSMYTVYWRGGSYFSTTPAVLGPAYITIRTNIAGPTFDIWDNGTWQANIAMGGTWGLPYTDALNLGSLSGWTRYNGRIAEIILYDRALTDPEIAQVNDYLNNRYFTPTISVKNYFEVDTTSGMGPPQLNIGNTTTNPDYDFLGSGTFTQSGIGQVTFGGNIDAKNGAGVSGSDLVMTGTNIDLDPTGTFDLTMVGVNTATITLADNLDIWGHTTTEPDDIANLKLWLRSDNPGIVLVGGKVQDWPDYSPSAATASAAGVQQPSYIASHPAFNNLPAIDFDGVNTYMNFVANAISSANTDQTLFLMLDIDVVGVSVLFDIVTGRLAYYLQAIGPILFNVAVYNAGIAITNGVKLITCRTNTLAATFSGWVNNTSTIVPYGNAKSMSGAERLGGNLGGGQIYDGRMAEIILYDRALTDSEVAQVHAYLNERYALGNGNNYFQIDTTPASEAMNFGNIATNPDYAFLGDGEFIQSGSGQVEFNGNIDAAGGLSVLTGYPLVISGTDIELSPSGDFTLDMADNKTVKITTADDFIINSHTTIEPDDIANLVLDLDPANPGIVLNSEMLTNGDCESLVGWSSTGGLSLQSAAPEPGNCIRIPSTGAGSFYAYQVCFSLGQVYHVTGRMRSDGIVVPHLDAHLVGTDDWVGTTSTNWQYFDITGVAIPGVSALGCRFTATGAGQYIEIDNLSVTSSGNVQSWPDYSPSAEVLSMAVALNQPLYVASHPAFNGQPAVYFDSVSDYLYTALARIVSASTEQTLFIVFDTTSWIAGNHVFCDFRSPGNVTMFSAQTDRLMVQGNQNTLLLTAAPGTAPRYLTWRKIGNSFEGWVNGISGGISAPNGTPSTVDNASGSTVGSWVGGTANAHGWMARLCLYDRALSDSEVAQVHAYLNERYALGTDNKYFEIDISATALNFGNIGTNQDFAFLGDGTFTQSGAGQVSFAGNVNTINGLDITAGAFTVGSTATNIDLDPTGTFALNMAPTKTAKITIASNLDAAFNIAAHFNPGDLSNLKLWLRSDNPGIVLNVDKVQSWPDYSPSGATASEPPGIRQPTYIASYPAFNGYPAVDFDGVNSFMSFAAGAILSVNTSQTVFAIIDFSSYITNYAILGFQFGPQAFYFNITGPATWNNGDGHQAAVAIPIGTHMLAWRADNGAGLLHGWVDGASNSTPYDNGVGLGGAEGLGAMFYAGNRYKGKMAEIILYDRALTDTEVAQVHAYLNNRYFTPTTSSNNYFEIDTRTPNAEIMNFGNTTTNPDYAFLGSGTFTQSGAGQVAFNGNLDIAHGLDVTAGNLTMTGTDINLDPTGSFNLDMTLGTSVKITVKDGIDHSFRLRKGLLDYLNIYTTNNFERMEFGNITINPKYIFLGSGDFTQDGVGQVTFWGNINAVNGVEISGGDFTLTSTNIDFDPNASPFSLDMTGGSTATITIFNNLDAAFLIKEAGNNYLEIDTRDNPLPVEIMNFGNTFTNPDYEFQGDGLFTQTGAGQVSFAGNVDAAGGLGVSGTVFKVNGTDIDLDPAGTFDLSMDTTKTITITMVDNLDASFLIKEGANNYFEIDTRDAPDPEKVNFGNTNTNPDYEFQGDGEFTQSGAGQVSFPGNVDAAGGLGVSGGDLIFTGTNVTLEPSGTFELTMANWPVPIVIEDNLDSSFSIERSVIELDDISDLKFWIRADTGITLNGGTVSAWDDITNLHDVTQPAPARQGIYIASHATLGNMPTVGFFTSQDMEIAGTEGTGDWTIGMVLDIPAYSASTDYLINGNIDPSTNTPIGKMLGYSIPEGWQDVTAKITGPQYIIWRFEAAINEGRIYRNTIDVGAGIYPTSRSPFIAASNDFLGGHTNQWIYLAECFAYKRALTGSEIAQIHAYFNERYSLGMSNNYFEISTKHLNLEEMNFGNAFSNPSISFLGDGDFDQSAASQVTFNGNLEAAGGIHIRVSEFNMTGVNVDMAPTGTFVLTMTGTDTVPITIADTTDAAFVIQEGANNYLEIDTRAAVEIMNFGNTTTNPDYAFAGSGLFTQSGAGQVSFAGNIDAKSGLDVPAGALTMTGTNIDLDPNASTFTLDMDANKVVTINLTNAAIQPDAIAGLDRWYRADAGNVHLTGGNVDTWYDLSGFDYHATTGGSNPLWVADLGGGIKFVTGDSLVAPAGVSFDDLVVFFVLNPTTTTLTQETIWSIPGSTYPIYRHSGGTLYGYMTPTGVNFGSWTDGLQLLEAYSGGTNPAKTLTAYKNCIYQNTGVTANTPWNNGASYIGGISSGTSSYVLHEIIIYRTLDVLQPANLAGIRQYLLDRYGFNFTALNIQQSTNKYFEIDSGTETLSFGNVTTVPDFTFLGAGDFNQSGAGQVSFAGNIDAARGVDITGGNFTMTGTNIDLDPNASTFTLGMTGGSTASITISDDLALAFNINEGGNLYFYINTTDGPELIRFGQGFTNPDYDFLGSGTFTQSGAGQVEFQGNVNADRGLDVTAGAFSMLGTDINLDPTGTFDLSMDNNQTITISIDVLLDSAFLIYGTDLAFPYIEIDTSASEIMLFGNANDNPDYAFLGSGTFKIGTGQIEFDGNMDTKLGVDVSVSTLTMTGTDINLDPTGTFSLDMDATKTITISLADNLNNAFLIKEGAGNNYFEIDTSGEEINFGNVDTDPDFEFLGDGTFTKSGSGDISLTGAITVVTSLDLAANSAPFYPRRTLDGSLTGFEFNICYFLGVVYLKYSDDGSYKGKALA